MPLAGRLLSTISVYDNYISHDVNQIYPGHNCLVIQVSPQFPDEVATFSFF